MQSKLSMFTKAVRLGLKCEDVESMATDLKPGIKMCAAAGGPARTRPRIKVDYSFLLYTLCVSLLEQSVYVGENPVFRLMPGIKRNTGFSQP